MSRIKKISLGALTLLANICILSFFVMMIPMFYSALFDPNLFEEYGDNVGLAVFIQSGITFFGFLLGFGLLFYYMMHINTNPHLNKEENEPLKWLFITFIGFTIGQLIYWYFKIWKNPKENISEEVIQ